MKGNKVENIEIKEYEDKDIIKSNEVEQAWVELEIFNIVSSKISPGQQSGFFKS